MSNYTIGGCQVHFPHQAYGVQLSFMNKVIAALEGGHNALLEAPTGSGKTLSLLCSALAWQVREKQRIEEGLAAEKAAAAEAAALGGEGTVGPEASPGSSKDCFKSDPPGSAGKAHGSAAAGPTAEAAAAGDGGFMADAAEHEAPAPRRKAPKIYYATRTHSQIAQVVKELKRSQYTPRMAVLGSRKHYCINKHAVRQSSIDEACEELLKESQCQYFKNVHGFVSSGYQYRLHDIEDLKSFGRSHKACPYYTARKWAEEAEVIFCPYSYLIDPIIRRAMSVDMAGCMLIFDEAHNIEDVCREAASTELDLATMSEVMGCFLKANELNGKPEVYGPLLECAQRVVHWMQDKERVAVAAMAQQRHQGGGRQATRYQDPYERLFPANQLLGELEACGLGPDRVDPLWEAYQAARDEEEAMAQEAVAGGGEGGGQGGDKENQQDGATAAPKEGAVRVGAMALGIMSRLIQVVRMLHQVSDDGARDYRLVVQRYYESQPTLAMGRYKSKGSGGGEDDSFFPGFAFKMCLWCMNPAVAFKPVADTAHSVVLTSGTLAPLEGFASELGTPFAITLEAPHVVDMRKQVWAGVVGAGPGGTPLNATWKNQNEPAFQDAVGRLIVESARTIPDGLLVFLPSYVLLDKLMARWKSVGLLSQLEALKAVVQEPRQGGQDALKKTMQDYYAAVAKGGGAVFFAVCRGKVSEGLDFADGNARGVIIVGIPFPHAKDLKVQEKKEFNNRGQRQLGLVSGDTWYSQQAFRALNQALGRCIRHRLDWGAILMVDERFKYPRNQKMLSRWVRGALAVHPSFEAGMHSMAAFFQAIQANPPGPPPGAAKPAGGGTDMADMAAAVAAAVAAAGPVKQQQHTQAGEEQAAGRGLEGALSLWGGGAGGQPKAGTILGLYEMWEAKPLGQARAAAPAAAAAAAAAPAAGSGEHPRQWGQQAAAAGLAAVVKQEPGADVPYQQQQPQMQQWRQASSHTEQQPPLAQPQHPAVKLEPGMQNGPGPGPWQQQQQQQQGAQASGWQSSLPHQQQQAGAWQPSRPHQHQQFQQPQGQNQRSASAGQEASPVNPAVRLQHALADAPLAAWAQRDVADCLAFLQGSGLTESTLPPGYQSLLAVSVDGIRDAFVAASEYMADGRSLEQLATEWNCSLPRGLQALMGAASAAIPPGKPVDTAALQFGEWRLRGWPPHQLLPALRAAYEAPLQAVLQRGGSPGGFSVKGQQQQEQAQQLHGQLGGTANWPQQQQQQACATPAGKTMHSGLGGTPVGKQQAAHQQEATTPYMEWSNAQNSRQPQGGNCVPSSHPPRQQQQQQRQQQPFAQQQAWKQQAAPAQQPQQQSGQHAGMPPVRQQQHAYAPGPAASAQTHHHQLAAHQHGGQWQHQTTQQHLRGHERQQQQQWGGPPGQQQLQVQRPPQPRPPMPHPGPNQQQGWAPQNRLPPQHGPPMQPPQQPPSGNPQPPQQQHLQHQNSGQAQMPRAGPSGVQPPPQQQSRPQAPAQQIRAQAPAQQIRAQAPAQQIRAQAPAQQGAKRGPAPAAAGVQQEGALKKRYLRSKNAEAAARNRAGGNGGGGIGGFEAAQRAAIANEIHSSDDEDFV